MKDFIVNYPIFSYIAVPVLLVVICALIVLFLKPDSSVIKNNFFALYTCVEDAIGFIAKNDYCLEKDGLKTIKKMIAHIKAYYGLLESEELYEVVVIIINIEKAENVIKALLLTGKAGVSASGHIAVISEEFGKIRNVLFGFNLKNAESGCSHIGAFDFGSKRNVKKAEEYLDHVIK